MKVDLQDLFGEEKEPFDDPLNWVSDMKFVLTKLAKRAIEETERGRAPHNWAYRRVAKRLREWVDMDCDMTSSEGKELSNVRKERVVEIRVQLNEEERWFYKSVEKMFKSHSVYETLDTEMLYRTCLQHWTKELFEETLNSLLEKGVFVKKEPVRVRCPNCGAMMKEKRD